MKASTSERGYRGLPQDEYGRKKIGATFRPQTPEAAERRARIRSALIFLLCTIGILAVISVCVPLYVKSKIASISSRPKLNADDYIDNLHTLKENSQHKHADDESFQKQQDYGFPSNELDKDDDSYSTDFKDINENFDTPDESNQEDFSDERDENENHFTTVQPSTTTVKHEDYIEFPKDNEPTESSKESPDDGQEYAKHKNDESKLSVTTEVVETTSVPKEQLDVSSTKKQSDVYEKTTSAPDIETTTTELVNDQEKGENSEEKEEKSDAEQSFNLEKIRSWMKKEVEKQPMTTVISLGVGILLLTISLSVLLSWLVMKRRGYKRRRAVIKKVVTDLQEPEKAILLESGSEEEA